MNSEEDKRKQELFDHLNQFTIRLHMKTDDVEKCEKYKRELVRLSDEKSSAEELLKKWKEYVADYVVYDITEDHNRKY